MAIMHIHSWTRVKSTGKSNNRRRLWCSYLDLICLASSNKLTVRRRQTAAIVIMVGHRSTLQSRVTVAVGYGGLPPCLDRFQAGRLGYMTKMSFAGRVNPSFTVCPVKCREVTVKKKRV